MALSWVEAGWNPAGHPSRFVATPDPIPLSDDLAALLCIDSDKTKTTVEAVDSSNKQIVEVDPVSPVFVSNPEVCAVASCDVPGDHGKQPFASPVVAEPVASLHVKTLPSAGSSGTCAVVDDLVCDHFDMDDLDLSVVASLHVAPRCRFRRIAFCRRSSLRPSRRQ